MVYAKYFSVVHARPAADHLPHTIVVCVNMQYCFVYLYC